MSTSPSDQGMSWNSISAATPIVAITHTVIVASIVKTGSGTGVPGCSRRHPRYVATTLAHQIHDPTTTSVSPM